jgi:hypothetical protein
VNALRHRATVALSTVAFLLAPYAAGAQTPPPAPPDLLVVGGTPSGLAAAVTAARDGESVVLVSANAGLGGTLTDAMMDQWDLNLAPDGSSLQGGIFAEIYARLGDAFTPAAAERTFAEMVAAEPRIAVRYDEVPVEVETRAQSDGRSVEAVTFRDVRSGALTKLGAPFVIDASDDGDVAALAGARYDVGRQDTGIDERMQAVTEMFTVDDVDWRMFAGSYDVRRFGAGGVLGRRAWGYSDVVKDYRPAFDDIVVRDLNFGLLPSGALSVNAIDVTGIDGRDPNQLAEAKRQTAIEAPRLVDYLRARLPGFASARVGIFAPDVYVRETRHIEGLERLTAGDVWGGRIPADSIGLASYPLDLHPVDPTDEPAYAPERHVYGIPFGALVPKGLTNLLLASPAISASHEASGSARVIPTTIEEGEADAVASVDAARHRLDFLELAARLDRRTTALTFGAWKAERALG